MMEGWGEQARDIGHLRKPPEAGKDEEMGFPQSFQKREHIPANNLTVVQSDLLTYRLPIRRYLEDKSFVKLNKDDTKFVVIFNGSNQKMNPEVSMVGPEL